MSRTGTSKRAASFRSPTARQASTVALAAVLGAVASPLLGVAPAQARETVSCTSSDFHCDTTGYAAVANKSFWTMASGHNCTNYVAYRLIRDGMSPKIKWLHNGGDWARDARKHQIPVNDQPTVGAVAQWDGGRPNVSWAGHVAYVQAVGGASITVIEDNYSSGPLRVRVIHKGDPAWPSNFIHFSPLATAVGSTSSDTSLLLLQAPWTQAAEPKSS